MSDHTAKVSDYIPYSGKEISFKYPKEGKVVEIVHSDGSYVTRLLGKVHDKIVNIDIERQPSILRAQDEIEQLSKTIKLTFDSDQLPPAETKVGNLTGWRYIHRLLDGGLDCGYLDTVMVDTPHGVYRIIMKANKDQYNKARIVFESLLQSFKLIV